MGELAKRLRKLDPKGFKDWSDDELEVSFLDQHGHEDPAYKQLADTKNRIYAQNLAVEKADRGVAAAEALPPSIEKNFVEKAADAAAPYLEPLHAPVTGLGMIADVIQTGGKNIRIAPKGQELGGVTGFLTGGAHLDRSLPAQAVDTLRRRAAYTANPYQPDPTKGNIENLLGAIGHGVGAATGIGLGGLGLGTGEIPGQEEHIRQSFEKTNKPLAVAEAVAEPVAEMGSAMVLDPAMAGLQALGAVRGAGRAAQAALRSSAAMTPEMAAQAIAAANRGRVAGMAGGALGAAFIPGMAGGGGAGIGGGLAALDQGSDVEAARQISQGAMDLGFAAMAGKHLYEGLRPKGAAPDPPQAAPEGQEPPKNMLERMQEEASKRLEKRPLSDPEPERNKPAASQGRGAKDDFRKVMGPIKINAEGDVRFGRIPMPGPREMASEGAAVGALASSGMLVGGPLGALATGVPGFIFRKQIRQRLSRFGKPIESAMLERAGFGKGEASAQSKPAATVGTPDPAATFVEAPGRSDTLRMSAPTVERVQPTAPIGRVGQVSTTMPEMRVPVPEGVSAPAAPVRTPSPTIVALIKQQFPRGRSTPVAEYEAWVAETALRYETEGKISDPNAPRTPPPPAPTMTPEEAALRQAETQAAIEAAKARMATPSPQAPPPAPPQPPAEPVPVPAPKGPAPKGPGTSVEKRFAEVVPAERERLRPKSAEEQFAAQREQPLTIEQMVQEAIKAEARAKEHTAALKSGTHPSNKSGLKTAELEQRPEFKKAMADYRAGKLRDSNNNLITNERTARKIAYSMADRAALREKTATNQASEPSLMDQLKASVAAARGEKPEPPTPAPKAEPTAETPPVRQRSVVVLGGHRKGQLGEVIAQRKGGPSEYAGRGRRPNDYKVRFPDGTEEWFNALGLRNSTAVDRTAAKQAAPKSEPAPAPKAPEPKAELAPRPEQPKDGEVVGSYEGPSGAGARANLVPAIEIRQGELFRDTNSGETYRVVAQRNRNGKVTFNLEKVDATGKVVQGEKGDVRFLAPQNISAELRDGMLERVAEPKKTGRTDIKAILANPETKRELMTSTIQATQAREGVETTKAQAEAAYDKVQAEKAAKKAAEASKAAPQAAPEAKKAPEAQKVAPKAPEGMESLSPRKRIKALLDAGDYENAAKEARKQAVNPDKADPKGRKVGYVMADGKMVVDIDADGYAEVVSPSHPQRGGSKVEKQYSTEKRGLPIKTGDFEGTYWPVKDGTLRYRVETPDGKSFTGSVKGDTLTLGRVNAEGRGAEIANRLRDMAKRLGLKRILLDSTNKLSLETEPGGSVSSDALRWRKNLLKHGEGRELDNGMFEIFMEKKPAYSLESEYANLGLKGPKTADRELLKLRTSGQAKDVGPGPEATYQPPGIRKLKPGQLGPGVAEMTPPDKNTVRPFAEGELSVEELKKSQPVSKGERYGLDETGRPVGKKITAKDIHRELPPEMRDLDIVREDGDLIVRTNRGVIRVRPENHIELDFEAVEAGYGKEMAERARRGEVGAAEEVTTVNGDALVRIVKLGKLGHGLVHVALQHFSNAKEWAMFKKKYAGMEQPMMEEQVAKAFEDLDARLKKNPDWQPKNALGRVLKRAYDFFHSVYRAWRPNEESFLRDVRGGKIFKRDVTEVASADTGMVAPGKWRPTRVSESGREYAVEGPRGAGSPLGRQLAEAEGLRKGAKIGKGAVYEKSKFTAPRLAPKQSTLAEAEKIGKAENTSTVATKGAVAPRSYSIESIDDTIADTRKYNEKHEVFPKEQVDKYERDLKSVASMVHADIERLGYDPLKGASALKGNSDKRYKKSLDFTTLCRRRYVLSDTVDAIQEALYKRTSKVKILEAEDIIKIGKDLENAGHEVNCGPCYVESRRINISTAINKAMEGFTDNNKKSKTYGKTLRVNPKYHELLKTQAGRDRLFEEHPDQYNIFSRAFAGTQIKVPAGRASYSGEILKLTDDAVETFNKYSGLRSQSWSDFEVPHLLDKMQAVYDMALRKLKGHSYTKEINYVETMKDTGEAINMSLIPDGDGFDPKGKLRFKERESIRDMERARKIRSQYDNVGFEAIGINDKHIEALLASPDIDYVIPYHSSGLSMEYQHAKGMKGWADYTDSAHWTDAKTGKAVGIEREIFVDEWQGDLKKLAKLEKERGVKAPFQQFRKLKGYEKLLVDRRIWDKNGKFIEQRPVEFKFDMDHINKMMREYGGEHRRGNAVQEVVDKYAPPDTLEKMKRGAAKHYSLEEKKPDMLTQMKGAAKRSLEETSGNTALNRKGPSAPALLWHNAGHIGKGKSVFDWGMGKGADLKFYTEKGAEAQGYDPNHQPNKPEGMADVVTSTYVANVLRPPARQSHLIEAYQRAKDKLLVSVRNEVGGKTVREEADGVIMMLKGEESFQKAFTQQELLDYLKKLFPAATIEAGPRLSSGVTAVVQKPRGSKLPPPRGLAGGVGGARSYTRYKGTGQGR